MGDEELAQTIVEAFLDDLPRQIESLRAAVAAGDVPGAERRAHTIKGASANMGGERLRAVAFEMEKAARGGDVDALRGFMKEMEEQFDDLRKAMEEGAGDVQG
jgi:HPt (histidine-containing phosphotransfer) domain-containing protein